MPAQPAFEKILAEASSRLGAASRLAEVEELRIRYLGRKGVLTEALRSLKTLPPAQRRAAGQAGNAAKQALEGQLFAAAARFTTPQPVRSVDVTVPLHDHQPGHLHPISLVLAELEEIFGSLGFSVVEGPEVEDAWHNFEALNMGSDHPARDMQDTFYVKGSDRPKGEFRILPRTHTSGVQIRTMETEEPPLRIIVPGRVYRNEAEDATHGAVFHQLEGLMVDQATSFADLKGILLTMAQRLLGADTKLRFRPSFFPYTEPSAEIDMSAPNVRDGAWIELGGAGMVHPDVLERVGYDPDVFQGFAFGIGPGRLAMLKYGIQDLRELYKPDIRIMEQF